MTVLPEHRIRSFLLSISLFVPVLFSPFAALAEPFAESSPPGRQARLLLQPVREAALSSELTARILKIPVRDGDRFKRGDLLVRFDCALYQAQRDVARVELKSARTTLKNIRQLAELNSAGALDVALAQLEVEKKKSQLGMARIPVQHCRITAPFSGRVVAVRVHEHELVQSGQPLLEILDDGELELKLVIPSNWLSWIRPDRTFTLRMDETGANHSAKVSKIGARIDPVSQTLKVTGVFTEPPPGLLAGMSGTAYFSPPP